jgi:hypothetical protein
MPNIYNSLPDIASAAQALDCLEQGFLSELSLLLIKYDLQSRFGISLVHRHFELNDDEEQLVELSGISSVFKNGVPDSTILHEFNLHLPDSSMIVPSMFIIRDTGLFPYEYGCTGQNDAKVTNDMLSQIDDRFFSEWTDSLARQGLTDKLGLAIMQLSTDGGLGPVRLVEQTYADRRVSVSRKSFDNEDMSAYIPGVWFVGPDSQPRVCYGCQCNSGHSGSGGGSAGRT